MHSFTMEAPPFTPDRLSERAFLLLAGLLAFSGYFLVFLLSQRSFDILDAALSSLINLAPLAIVSAGARRIIARHLLQAGIRRQLLGHIVLAPVFALIWYWLLMVLIGVRSGGSVTEFVVRAFFPQSAMTWQLLQGLTFYALVAALTALRAKPPVPSFIISAAPSEAAKESNLSRYFIRSGEDIHPVNVSEIISIRGADDYAEVWRLRGAGLRQCPCPSDRPDR